MSEVSEERPFQLRMYCCSTRKTICSSTLAKPATAESQIGSEVVRCRATCRFNRYRKICHRLFETNRYRSPRSQTQHRCSSFNSIQTQTILLIRLI
ncbi:unnamed protein product [Zymoseptoria tritici ST99CH_1A5]|uniref:Uncharacterized protein n=1 Tax=Zymoseptoria tritici ST99CH_1A5 TaxID=1276529 RepID=A0A1Y6LYC3_ZYMTR|nr:unnamed protein product [Zymoseptoria tritici ST99CH_3D1]SMY29387.1 unnamed protein product [Zymoseptoria tritici ST99CH_1A5]